MRRLVSAIVCGVCVSSVMGVAGCSSPAAPDRSVKQIAIEVAAEDFEIGSGVTIFLAPGETLQLGAEGHLGDGSEIDLTQNAQWSSDDPGIVSVTQTGVVTGVAEGTTKIRARFAEFEGTANFGTAGS